MKVYKNKANLKLKKRMEHDIAQVQMLHENSL